MFNDNHPSCINENPVAESANINKIGRLDFIRKLSLLSGVIITGCSPVKILLDLYPDKYDDDVFKKQVLTAFVTTVIPGANPNEPDICTIFSDEYYPFYKYCGFFVSDICKKSMQNFDTENFYELNLMQRTLIVQEGLKDDSTTARIYTAATYITQVSYYCSIYDDEKGCDLIDFEGSYGFMNAEININKSNIKLAKEITLCGNYS